MSDPLGPHDPSGRDLLDERMDARLKEHGARWRDALPAPAPVVEPATRARSARPWLVPAAAAAAVALVLGVSATLTRDDDDKSGPADGPSSAVSDDTCGPGDLVASDRRLSQEGGTAVLSARLDLAPGASPCLVDDFPEVELLGRGDLAAVRTTHSGLDAGGTTVISPDDPAVVELTWPTSGLDCFTLDNTEVRITIGDGAQVTIEGFGPACVPGGKPPPVRVLPLLTEEDPGDQDVTVRGTVSLVGGPQGGSYPVTSGEVSFDGQSTSAASSIDADGSYRVTLPPGTYDVTVSTPDWNGGQTFADGKYHADAGTANQLDVSIPIR